MKHRLDMPVQFGRYGEMLGRVSAGLIILLIVSLAVAAILIDIL